MNQNHYIGVRRHSTPLVTRVTASGDIQHGDGRHLEYLPNGIDILHEN